MRTPVSKAVAIVGISAELPSGSYTKTNLDHHTFFDFLLEKGQSYETVPNERFDSERWHGVGLGHIITEKGSFLKNVPLFDHVEFGITTKDAKNMSLSTRKLIEHSFLAFLDAGIDYRGRNVGCYMSGTAFDMQGVSEPDELEAVGSFAGYPYMIANKVSYHLDLRGPSIPLDTACSSSLTALHLAIQAIQAGDCESAVVGGCQLNFRLVDFIQYSQGSVLSPDGTCKPLDESANGFSRGEGVTAIVLKPLEDAIRDNDHVYATILGTGINSSGSLAPVSAPVAAAQKAAMYRAFSGTGRSPREVDYVELHATGTAAGDPTEANWAGEVFGQRESELLVGSVKGNIGHLEICAFLASLLKVCSVFQTRLLPPTVNLTTPNPAIGWDRWNMRAPTEVTPIAGGHQLLVSITSSGIGGSNGHVVVESFQAPQSSISYGSYINDRPLLVLCGGLSPQAASEISSFFQTKWTTLASKDLDRYASDCSRRGRQMPWQTFSIMSNDTALTPFTKPVLLPKSTPRIAYVFSGQGPQYIQMGSRLFGAYPIFRESILKMDTVYEMATGHSIRSLGLFCAGAIDKWDIWPISVTLPAIAMVQMAMYDFLSSIGITPDVVVGHSAGETAMMYASGACSREMALQIAIARGIALATLEDLGGSMVALSCGPDMAQSIIDDVMKDRTGILQIACYNSDSAVTLAGAESLLEMSIALAKSRDISAHKLRAKIAVHSEFVNKCKTIYCQKIEDIFAQHPGDHKPRIATYSSTCGTLLESFTPEYFWHNARQPVSFNTAIKSIIKDRPGVAFLEISPHPVLSTYITDNGVEGDHVISFMKRTKVPQPYSESHAFLLGVAKLSLIGYTRIDFHALNSTRPSPSEDVPYYPFARKYIPFRPEHPKSTLFVRESEWSGPLLHPGLRLNAFTHPKLAEHIIMGEPILPAAGFLEMIFEAGANLAWNVHFQSMLPLTSERLLPVKFHQDGPSWSVISELQSSTSKKRIHAEGFMASDAVLNTGKILIEELKQELQQVDIANFYQTLAHFAQYGPVYQRVTRCWKSKNEALVEVRAYDQDLLDLDKYIIHPALLDASFHAIVHPMFTSNADRSVYYLPMSIETVALYDPAFIRRTLPKHVYSQILYKSWDPAGITFDLSVTDTNGTIICQLLGFRVARHEKMGDTSLFKHQAMIYGRHDIIYQPLAVTLPHLPSNNEGIHAPPLLFKQLNSQDPATSQYLEAHSFIKNDCKDSLAEVLSFLHVQGGKKVIRLLSIGTEFLDMIHTITTDQEPTYMLDIHVLAPPHSIPVSPASSKIGRIISPVAKLAISNHASDNQFDTFYDVILDQFDAGKKGSRENLKLAAVLPGGFIVLSPADDSANGPSKDTGADTSPVLHAILRKSVVIRASPYPTSFAKERIGSQDPLCSERCTFSSKLPDTLDTAQKPTIVSFHLDNVLAIRREVQMFSDHDTLWVQASRDIQGYAAIGFVRSLRKELVSKDIRLALFDTVWSEAERTKMVSSFSSSPYIEKEVFVDSSGTICVPRLIPASFNDSTELTPTITTDDKLVATKPKPQPASDPILVPLGHVPVRISASSMEFSEFIVIVGNVSAELEPTPNKWEPGTSVIGIASRVTTVPDSGLAMIHEHSLIPLPNLGDASPSSAAHCAFTILIAALAIGSKVLMQPDALRDVRVLITEDNSEDITGKSLTSLLTLLGVSVVRTSKNITPSIISEIRTCNIALSGWINRSDLEVITSILPVSARLFSWNSQIPDMLAHNQWVAADILRDTQNLFVDFLEHGQLVLESRSALPVSDEDKTRAKVQNDLFKPSQEYFLIGGLGSLGIRLAFWMYENGARNLVLTSRRGASSLADSKDEMSHRVLTYLEGRPDLRLRLEACDASSEVEMSNLFQSSDTPIGGCILMSVVLADKLFVSHDDLSFSIPFPSKVGALTALEHAIDITSVDFLVSLSSAATLGNVGQTNYSSANTAVDGLLSKYQNAFSLVAPAIIDSITISHGLDLMPDQRFREWLPWSMTCSELFECLADGIRSISQTKFSLYVPKLNWYQMKQHLGSSPMYDHLVYESTMISNQPTTTSKELLRSIIMKTLDIGEDDFSSDIPFTSYGLDSLTAGRLSHSLKPFLQLSQLQLLADISLNHIEKRINDGHNLPAPVEEPILERQFDWKLLNQPGQSVVKLVNGEGIPLILIHGGSGNIVAFIALQERFTTPLWAIQNTPECPTTSLKEIAAFYFLQIKAAQPSGPYRLGGYSACCILAVEIAYLLKSSGDRVVQMALLDHSPTLYSSPIFPLDDETIRTRRASQRLITTSMDALLDVYSREPGITRQKVGLDLKRAQEGQETSDVIRNYVTFIHHFISISATFLIELCDIKAGNRIDFADMNRRLRNWILELDVPLTLFVAENGIFKTIPHPNQEWTDLSWMGTGVINVPGGHFGMLECAGLVEALESGWHR